MKRFKKIILIILGILILGLSAAYFYFKSNEKTIAILLYDDFTMLDVVGAYQTFPSLFLNNYRMKFVAKNKGLVKSSHLQSLHASYSFDEISDADILFIPGGSNMDKISNDTEIINWINKINSNSSYTLSVSNGSLLLGKNGALKGKNISTQWFNKKILGDLGAVYNNKSYVKDGKYYSGKGASASIDMVLALINDLKGEKASKAMQLFIEYDPKPPVSSGMYDESDSITKSIADNLIINNISSASVEKKSIIMFLYDGFTMLDMIGPYQVFKELAPLGYDMKFVAKEKGTVSSDMILSLHADFSIKEIDSAAILFIPGGSSTADVMIDSEVINWVKKMDNSTSYSTSVCTGSMIYAKAGLLNGKNASTHWFTGQFLKDYNVTFTHDRYTKDGKYITGAGVSSGIDLALLIVKEVVSEAYANAIKLKIGYHPNPPFNAGSPEKSSKETVEYLSKMFSSSTAKYNAAKDK